MDANRALYTLALVLTFNSIEWILESVVLLPSGARSTFNSIEWIHSWARAPRAEVWAVALSIPLNGFREMEITEEEAREWIAFNSIEWIRGSFGMG